MKHVKLFFALFAMLALGVGNAWGAEKTVSWTATTNSLGSAISAVNGTATGTIKTGDFEWNYTRTLVSLKEGKSDHIAMSSGYMQLGSSNAGETLQLTTSNIPGTIKSVAVDCWSKNGAHNLTISVGGTSYYSGATPTSGSTKSGTGTSSGTIDINFTISKANALCVKSITVIYEEALGDGIVETLKSISVEGMTTTYEQGDAFEFDGTCTATYAVTKNDVAQEDKTIEVIPTVSTPDMTVVGTQTITVSYTDGDETATTTYTINITENVVTPGTYTGNLNNVFFGCATGNNATEQSGKFNDILVVAGCTSSASTKTNYQSGHVRFYADSYLTLSVPTGYVINSIVFTADGDWKGSISVNAGTYTNDTKSWAGSAQEVVFSFAAQNRIATATVTYAEASETPEVPTLDAPTFDLEEGTYNEAKEVTLSAEEGTIYYTLDGTTPDAESIEYTDPIVLDECGEITIKAIAISGEITSSVASATYTIKLPLNNSQANPYTEADAIEVYDGGCYDNQDVYVTGVVTSASYNSTYRNYTITLKGGFQFYRFQETAENKFTENYITTGDTLVACGKLVKYGETYELGEGCYLVERKPYSAPKVDISNTKETAYTVAEAIALIDDITSDLTKQVYVKGIVSEIVTPYDAEYGNITYNISSDGSTSSPQFQLYRGKSYDGENFTSADDIKVGDKVVVYGEMKKHNSTYEMNAGNQLVALEREDTTTGVDNVEATVAAKKAIINGQLVIVKDGVKFNALGQVIK